MKLVDANLLIYATNSQTPRHAASREWLTAALSSNETVALPTMVLLAFVRLTTNARVMDPPLPADAAIEIVDGWRRHPSVVVPEPLSDHFGVLLGLLEATGTAGNLVPDAHLAALAIEHGATLCSADNDFSRFPGLKWVNPLDSM